jgi:hypothetical protein
MTLNNIVLSSAAFIIGAALFIGTPVYAAEKSTLSDPTIAALWAQIEVLQKQIAELQKAQAVKVLPVFGAAIATSTASSETSTSTEAKLKKHNDCMRKREAQKYKKISCFYEW